MKNIRKVKLTPERVAELELLSTLIPLREEAEKQIDAACAAFRESALSYVRYNVMTNVPRGILALEEVVPHAIEHGFIGAAAAINKWGVDETVKLAIALLEDANCHREANAVELANKSRDEGKPAGS